MNARPPRIAIVSAVFPFPADNGKKVALSGFVRFFLDQAGAANFTYVKVGAAPVASGQNFGIRHIPLCAPWRRMASAIVQALVLRRRSLQEALLYTPALRARLKSCIEDIDADIVILDTIRIGQFFDTAQAEQPQRRWVLYMEDLYSRRYTMMLEGLRQGMAIGNPLGAAAEWIPAQLRPFAQFRVLQAMLLRMERSLVARRERMLARTFPTLCLGNREEAALAAAMAPAAQVWETPPCLPTVTSARHAGAASSKLFVILGALNYPPNAAAVLAFLETTMPIVAARLPDVRIRIVGRGASEDLRALAARWPQCELAGFVADLSELLTGATAMLVPVKLGSGPKLKTLDALAHGLPLISTHNGVMAIPVEDGVHALISDDLMAFPSLMEKVMNPALNQALSERSRALYEALYAQPSAYRHYAAAFLGDSILPQQSEIPE